MSATENHETAQPLAVPLSDQLGPDFVPAGWQERQKLTNGGQWTHWYECQPFPRSAPRDFMIGLIPAQRRILQTEDQAMTAINAAVAAERERGECGSGAGCLHKVATIEHQAAEIERLTADRDSWAQQASDRVADCAQYLAEIERLRSSLRGFVDRQMQYYDGLATITVSRGAVLAARDLLGPNARLSGPNGPQRKDDE